MQTVSVVEPKMTATGGGLRFGYAMLAWAITGNVLQAAAAAFSICSSLTLISRGFAHLYGLSLIAQWATTVIWVPLGIAWSMRDTVEGKAWRNHCLEIGGRLGCSYTLIALAIVLCEMFFRL